MKDLTIGNNSGKENTRFGRINYSDKTYINILNFTNFTEEEEEETIFDLSVNKE